MWETFLIGILRRVVPPGSWTLGVRAATLGVMDFGRQLFGYKRSIVDRYVSDHEAALTSARLELERLRASEPLLRASDEISSLLTSFAMAVSTTREQAERDAIAMRRAAEEYAESLKAETLRQCNEARAKAAADAEAMVRRAHEEVANVQRAQERVESALGDAARGIFSLMELLEHTRTTPGNGNGERAQQGAAPSANADPQSPSTDTAALPSSPSGAAEPSPPDTANRPSPPGGWGHTSAPDPVVDLRRVGGRPFDEVRVDPRDGMVVHFAPPPDPHTTAPAVPGPDAPEHNAVSGEGEPDWHRPGNDGAAADGTTDAERESEPPPWGT